MKRLLLASLTALLAPALSADTLHPGVEATPVAAPVAGAPTLVLQDGRFVVFDAPDVDLYAANGSFLSGLGNLANGAQLGAFRLSNNENFVLVGDKNSGALYRMWVSGAPADFIATLAGNTDAAFESGNNRVLISAQGGAVSSGYALWRLTISSGALEPVLTLPGNAGPVAVLSDGDAVLAPAPAAGDADVLRVDASDLNGVAAPVWVFEDDLLVVEIEAVAPTGDWVSETQYDGYTGASYYRWNGPDLFNNPGQGVLSYDFLVEEAGNYQLRIRNRHQHPDSTLENDCWARMDGHEWIKVFSGGSGSVDNWVWASTMEPESGPSVPANYDLTPGVHTLQLSGRSKNFMIDRFHLFLDGTPTPTQSTAPPSPLQTPGLELTELVAGGFDGIDGLAVDPAFDTIIVSESDFGVANQRIHLIGDALPAPLRLFETDSQGFVHRVQFVPGTGNGFFYPFQPGGNGTVLFQREDLGTGTVELLSLDPARPELALTGPGTVGAGAVQMQLSGAWPSGLAMLILDDFASVNGSSSIYPLPSGLPLIFTPFDDGSAKLLPFFLPTNANGELTIGFQNSLGLVGTTVFQYLVFDETLELFGTSAPALW